jgi:hypothetical protein
MAKPINISSNWTLFLKILFPVFWIVFFGLLTIMFWLIKTDSVGGLSIGAFRLLMTSFYLTGLGVMYFSVFQLKRVEVDEAFVYITNYKQTARYPFHNIESLKEANYYFFKAIRLHFKTPGIFGEQVLFLANSDKLSKILKKKKELSDIYEQE